MVVAATVAGDRRWLVQWLEFENKRDGRALLEHTLKPNCTRSGVKMKLSKRVAYHIRRRCGQMRRSWRRRLGSTVGLEKKKRETSSP